MNNQNLTHKLTAREQRAGGLASVKARRERRAFRELMERYLDEPSTYDGETLSRKEIAALRAVRMLADGSLPARDFARMFELVRDTLGEKPSERVEVESREQAKFAELLEQLSEG